MRKSKYNTELAEYGKRVISEYINNCKAQNKRFANTTQLIKEMMSEFVDKPVSESSVRRYLKELNFVFHSPSSYGFEPNMTYFDKYISYVRMQKHCCFLLDDTKMGEFFAEKINDYYRALWLHRQIYCIAVQNLLVCFYNHNEELDISDKRLKYEIPEILSKYYFNKEE